MTPGNTATIIFSRNRAAQLDLLLRSIHVNASRLANPVHILYEATEEKYAKAYRILQREHRNVSWWVQRDFQRTLWVILNYLQSPTIMCMTDDSVVYRKHNEKPSASPANILAVNREILCFSLRLGHNTTRCYPMESMRQQASFTTRGPLLMWDSSRATGDFGYPGSLDGHVFRSDQFRALISRGEYANPNELEDVLSQAARRSFLKRMASYQESLYLSIPANRVQISHENRFMATASMQADVLNDGFLRGGRLALDGVGSNGVDAAHVEHLLAWERIPT